MVSVSRRRFLTSTALSGAAIVAGRSATAFTEKPMDAETHKLYASACGTPEAKAYHQQLLEAARRQLPTGIGVAEAEAAVAVLTCPICGCKLAG